MSIIVAGSQSSEADDAPNKEPEYEQVNYSGIWYLNPLLLGKSKLHLMSALQTNDIPDTLAVSESHFLGYHLTNK